jgi:Cupin superfamily protein
MPYGLDEPHTDDERVVARGQVEGVLARSLAGIAHARSSAASLTPARLARAAGELARLLGGQAPEQFFEHTWERDAALHRGALGEAEGLLACDEFEALVAVAAADSSSRVSIVDKIARPIAAGAGEAEAVASVFRAYHAGSTLLLTDLQRHWGPIAWLCRALEGELLDLGIHMAQRINANAYLTPARSQGFDIHYDDHCVFIVQLAGAKQWQVHAPRVELPIERCVAPIPADQLEPPILEATLVPGDVLYIPRGFPHAARTGSESSLHLTIGLHTLTWWALVHDALRSRPALRRSVPRSFGGRDAQAYFDDELAATLVVTHLDERIERKAAEWVARRVPVPRGRLRAIDGLRGDAIDAGTRVARVDGALCVVHRDGDDVVMQIPGATLRLPAVMEDALAFIACTPAFSPAELPLGRAAFDRVQLVRILIRDGLVEVVPAPGDEEAA